VPGNSEIAVEVRPLTGADSPRSSRRNPAAPASGVLEQIQGTRLTIYLGVVPVMPCGTLVSVETSTRVYLGEIRHVWEGRIFVDFEHELEKASLEALRRTWL
jgi:hypothetical protein